MIVSLGDAGRVPGQDLRYCGFLIIYSCSDCLTPILDILHLIFSDHFLRTLMLLFDLE